MRKHSLTLLAASSAIAVATLFNVARAAEPAGTAFPPHGAHDMRGLTRLHDQLKLSPQQEQAWQQALAHMKQNHAEQRKNRQQFKAMIDAAKQQKILDLAGMRAQRDKIFEENRRLRDDTENQWLAVYNGLNDSQKEIVSNAIKARMAKMAKWHEHRMQRRRNAQHPGAAPAPAPQGNSATPQ